jgi:hypothetical protein
MNPTKPAHRPLASLKLPKAIGALITYANGIVTAMTGNPAFPSPIPALALVTAAIAALQVAETSALTRSKGAAAARNDKRAALVDLLEQLKAYVQAQANATPENGLAIIQSGGLAVRKTATHATRAFTANPGPVSGSVKLYTKSVGQRSAYLWEYSTDGGKTWVALPSTLQTKTAVSGLQVGSTAYFRYRAVTKTGETEWSQPISVVVK